MATDNGWDRTEFLTQLCGNKAGLDPYCWRDDATAMYVFTAQVF